MQTIREIKEAFINMIGELTISLSVIIAAMYYFKFFAVTVVKNTLIITFGQ